MCGIFGCWSNVAGDALVEQDAGNFSRRIGVASDGFDGLASFSSAQIGDAMASTLRHRGPDDRGLWMDASAGVMLGHTRLAIRDPAQSGAQPMVSADGRWVISYNGELYGLEAVRQRLRAHGTVLKGHSDTEILLEACALWGVRGDRGRTLGHVRLCLVGSTPQATLVRARSIRQETVVRRKVGLAIVVCL